MIVSQSPSTPDFEKPFVFFRKAGDTHIQYWRSYNAARRTSAADVLHTHEHIWVTAPFDFYETPLLWAFDADERLTFALNRIEGVSIPAHVPGLLPNPHMPDTPQNDFESWVDAAAGAIRAGEFTKTALSKIRNHELPHDFDWTVWFNRACERFPNAMVFFVHIPGVFTWAGATPELFLSAHGGRVSSVSLAGTLHPGSTNGWTHKETEEQVLVTDYIKEVFQRSGLGEVAVSGPEILSIGSLRHLKTSFSAPYRNGQAENLAALVEALHPTPAVGGLPKTEGIRFLLDHETHPRHWYAGFLGNVSGPEMNLFVNLRCMSIWQGGAVLYAGAGITGHSNPHAEWQETESKLRMNLDLLI